MDDYLIPAGELEIETRVSNSLFIAGIKPVFSTAEADQFLASVKEKYPDATHHVPAYVIGHGATVIAHAGDDGEPSGTAGRPALAVLQGSGLGDAAVVISRYFGGTKLGTGGLVKAYGDAARMVIEAVPKAKKVTVHLLQIVLDYPHYEVIKGKICGAEGRIKSEEFTDTVKLRFQLPADRVDAFHQQLDSITRGQVDLTVLKDSQSAFFPVKRAGSSK